MGIIRVAELPKCNFCNEDAKYDGPTKQGPWAHMCPEHNDEHGVSTIIGSEFVLGIAKPVGGEPVMGYLQIERSMSEDMLIILCSECKYEKHLELDADGVYTCDGCGKSVKVPTIM